jgi:hypothetical protein
VIRNRLVLDNSGQQPIAALRFRADDAVLVILQRASDVADALDEAVLGDDDAGPDRLEQLVLVDDMPGMSREMQQDLE